jgi:TonB-linked SusC/RagA family outer membrane protein
MKKLTRTRVPYSQMLYVLMRCSFTVLCIICVTAGLLPARDAKAQKMGEVKVSLFVKNEKLEKVFRLVESQTSFRFIYNTSQVKNAATVSVSLSNASVEQVLAQVLPPLYFSFEQTGTRILVKAEDSKLALLPEAFYGLPADTLVTVRGLVTDPDGRALAGVNIRVKGMNQYTTSDKTGAFALMNVDANALIELSFVGYVVKEIKAGAVPAKISMVSAYSKLDEVQVIAYGTTTKRLNTGNVSTLKAEDIEKQPVNNVLLALQGRSPGVFITQNSGLPNSTVKVQIRGTNTMAQGTDPLYVIDGVPYAANMLANVGSSGAGDASPLSFINPSSIESIDVLKDADATAIYGSRGANGVILITTKKGQAGAAKFSANVYTGISRTPAKAKLMNRDQYLAMRNEAFRNTGITKSVTNAPDLLLWDTTRNENWQKRLLGHASLNTDAQLSLSGGTLNSSYRIFGGYNKTTPPFPGSFKADKLSGGMSLSTASANKRFTAQFSMSYLVDNTFLPSYNPVTGIMLAPVAPEPFNTDGSINYKDYSTNNPFPGFYTTYKGKTSNLVTNISLSYRIVSSLVFKIAGGYNSNVVNGNYRYSIAAQVGNPFISIPSASANFSYNTLTSRILEPQLSYNGSVGKGKWEALLGTTFQENNSNGQLLYGSGYTSDAQLTSLAAATIVTKGASTYEQSKFNSLFGRINYRFEDKYLVNLTGRKDGSSRFGPDRKFGNFGAAGIGWIFSKEQFIASRLPFLSFGKLRASYGITGNEPGGNYQYLSLHDFYTPARPYQNAQGIYPGNLLSADYAWERVKKMEGGLELGFLKDRILASVSYFNNRSSNQLVSYDLPGITGFTSVYLNRDATIQNTGLEFTLNTQNIKTTAFTWSSNFNLTVYKNKLLAFPGIEKTPYRLSLIVGQPLSILQRYRAAGVDPQTGVYQFYNSNGDLTFTPTTTDMTATVNTDPRLYGGFQNSFTYRNFSLDVFLQFVQRRGFNYYFISLQAPGRSYFGDGNQPVAVLDRWQKPGDKATYQKFTSSSGNIANAYAYQQYSDAAYTDASYIRLKNVSFSYKLPQTILKKSNIEQARFYFQAQNLFTLTHYKGLDPEGQGTTPPLSIWTVGAQLTF